MLEVARTSTLGIIVVCRECPHTPDEDTSAVWADGNGDIYYSGTDKESLAAFLFHHG